MRISTRTRSRAHTHTPIGIQTHALRRACSRSEQMRLGDLAIAGAAAARGTGAGARRQGRGGAAPCPQRPVQACALWPARQRCSPAGAARPGAEPRTVGEAWMTCTCGMLAGCQAPCVG